MWFDGWSGILRILLVGSSACDFLVVAIRASGKRTLAQLNAFDFVVTVALDSTPATIILSSDVSWTEGAVALALLVLLQDVVSQLRRLRGGRKALTAELTLLAKSWFTHRRDPARPANQNLSATCQSRCHLAWVSFAG